LRKAPFFIALTAGYHRPFESVQSRPRKFCDHTQKPCDKAQIHAGGRGKGKFKEADAGDAGGVRLTKSVEEAAQEAKKMLGRTLVTHQTGPAGKQVR